QATRRRAAGGALLPTLQDKAVPMPVERTLMCPPRCRMGAITLEERAAVRGRSPVGAKYDTPVNRESAYEILTRRNASAESPAAKPDKPVEPSSAAGTIGDLLWGTKRRQGMLETMAKQAARTVATEVGPPLLPR